MMLNLSNPLTVLITWLLLETCHSKWVRLQLSQWGGLLSHMSASFTRPSWCMKLCGRITVLLIWWICVLHGVFNVYDKCMFVLLKMIKENLVFFFNAKCAKAKWGTVRNMEQWEKWSYEVKLRCNKSHLTVGDWGFWEFISEMREGE